MTVINFNPSTNKPSEKFKSDLFKWIAKALGCFPISPAYAMFGKYGFNNCVKEMSLHLFMLCGMAIGYTYRSKGNNNDNKIKSNDEKVIYHMRIEIDAFIRRIVNFNWSKIVLNCWKNYALSEREAGYCGIIHQILGGKLSEENVPYLKGIRVNIPEGIDKIMESIIELNESKKKAVRSKRRR